MNKTDIKIWARQEIVEAAEKRLAELEDSADGLSVEDKALFQREIYRVRAMFGEAAPKGQQP